MNLSEYRVDRDRILTNLETKNIDEIKRFLNKYDISIPEETVMIKAKMHQLRMNVHRILGLNKIEVKQLQFMSKNFLDGLSMSYDYKEN